MKNSTNCNCFVKYAKILFCFCWFFVVVVLLLLFFALSSCYYQLIRKSRHNHSKGLHFSMVYVQRRNLLQSSLFVIQFLLNMTRGDVFVSTRCNISTRRKLTKQFDKIDVTGLHL